MFVSDRLAWLFEIWFGIKRNGKGASRPKTILYSGLVSMDIAEPQTRPAMPQSKGMRRGDCVSYLTTLLVCVFNVFVALFACVGW